jgi:hypothetical protein
MFCANISPSGGNNDSIRGGLVHLLYHARLVFEAGRECEGMRIDVMHFIFSEMKIAMLDKKIPPYAPYIMRLILDKGIEGDFEIEEDFLCDDMEVHKPNKLYKKTTHLSPSTSSAFPPSSDVLGGNRYASGCRRKNADPPSGGMGQEMKKLKWWQRALFCMNNDVHQTQYKDYVERTHIHKKQWDLDARLRIVEKGKGLALKKSPKSKISLRTPSPLASGMRAHHSIGRNWPKSPQRARKQLKKKMRKKMKMTMEMKMRRMRTLTHLRIDLVVFSPFLVS